MPLDPHKIWVDGCFDFTHHGHAGAILQARRIIPRGAEGSLLCGVHNDADILFNKGGLPVMTQDERYEHTRSNKWCSAVIQDAPYVTQPDVLDSHGCQYVVHGDDISTDANGEDCYQTMKDMGRFLVVKRTEGVSTTEIIHRILTGERQDDQTKYGELQGNEKLAMYATADDGHTPWCFVFNQDFSHVLVEGGYKFVNDETVYIEGDFDLFHMGHIDRLRQLKEIQKNKKLIIGVTSREDCVMTLTERVLTVLSCRYVDGVVIEPRETNAINRWDSDAEQVSQGRFAYLSKQTIIDRIEKDRHHYVERNKKKGMNSEA